MITVDFELRGDHISLDALLKATGQVASGGGAKGLIAAGEVLVNGQAESRRGRKVRAGDVVALRGHHIHVLAPAQAAAPEV
jgi:ribosome-associated protein